MQILKLLLPAASLLIAGQALAHKAPRSSAAIQPTVRLMPAQTDTSPTALLDRIGGKTASDTASLPGQMLPAQPIKNQDSVNLNNHRH